MCGLKTCVLYQEFSEKAKEASLRRLRGKYFPGAKVLHNRWQVRAKWFLIVISTLIVTRIVQLEVDQARRLSDLP